MKVLRLTLYLIVGLTSFSVGYHVASTPIAFSAIPPQPTKTITSKQGNVIEWTSTNVTSIVIEYQRSMSGGGEELRFT